MLEHSLRTSTPFCWCEILGHVCLFCLVCNLSLQNDWFRYFVSTSDLMLSLPCPPDLPLGVCNSFSYEKTCLGTGCLLSFPEAVMTNKNLFCLRYSFFYLMCHYIINAGYMSTCTSISLFTRESALFSIRLSLPPGFIYLCNIKFYIPNQRLELLLAIVS